MQQRADHQDRPAVLVAHGSLGLLFARLAGLAYGLTTTTKVVVVICATMGADANAQPCIQVEKEVENLETRAYPKPLW